MTPRTTTTGAAVELVRPTREGNKLSRGGANAYILGYAEHSVAYRYSGHAVAVGCCSILPQDDI